MGEKTEQPTPKKLSDARKKGQVPSSKDLVSAALLVALFALLATQAPTYFTTFSAMLLLPTHYLGPHFDFGFALQQTLNGLAALMLWLVLPVLLVAAVVAIAAHVVQFGLLLDFESLNTDLKKLNPM
jgi:type III secretion protein U